MAGRRGGRSSRGVRKQFTLRVPSEHFELYEAEARRHNIPIADYLAEALARQHGLPEPEYVTTMPEPNRARARESREPAA